MNRFQTIEILLTSNRKQLENAASEIYREAAQQRLDTNRAYLESLDDEALANRVGMINAPRNSRCACDGSVCSCTKFTRSGTARTDAHDPGETPRERMIRAQREAALGPSERRDAAYRPEPPEPAPTYDGDPNASPRERMMQRNAAEGLRPLGREVITTNGERGVKTRVLDEQDQG